MSTDLHLVAERREADGRWSSVEPADGSRLYDWCQVALFGVLAGVRNDDARAGEPYRPIAVPRGLPADVSEEMRQWADDYGSDGHSHSWLSVRELVDYDWQQVVVRRGVVRANVFARWNGIDAPAGWCLWVLSSAECDLDNDQMRQLVARAQVEQYPLPEPPHSFRIDCPPGISAELHDLVRTRYTTIEWRETYARSCDRFLDMTLPKLLALGPMDDLRIVFFFDN